MQICRTRFKKQIITEFVPPKNLKSTKVMIFCSGVPSVPCKDDVLEFWAKKGYWTFFPRYRGTWESSGSFLEYSLEKDILDVVSSLDKPFTDYWLDDKYKLVPKQINIVGSSFGGPAAILATRDPRISKAICISPVVDWVAEDKSDPLKDLSKFLHLAYGGSYRIHKRNFNKLAKGTFYNPVNHMDEIDGGKVMIFHAKDDDIVRYKPVAKFASKTKCEFVSLKKGGHLSSSIMTKKSHYNKVKKFLAS